MEPKYPATAVRRISMSSIGPGRGNSPGFEKPAARRMEGGSREPTAYFAFDDIFFTIASTSFRSLSFKLTE
jgi:hypothetical protein